MASHPKPKRSRAAHAWRYILELYGRPGVTDLCLDWQDRLGADVILVLWLLWLGTENSRAIDEVSLRRIDAHAGEWRNSTVLPIRLARRAVGKLAKAGDSDAADIYARLKRTELAAERFWLKRIIRRTDLGTPHPSPETAGTLNLELYLRTFAKGDSKLERNTIEQLVRAASSVASRR